jgi:predicted phage tail protein
VDITSTITTDEGKVVFNAAEERDSSDLGGKSGGYGYSARVPLKDIPPGRYVLTVSAKSRMGQNPSVQRQVRITVTAPTAPPGQ